jgi:hypothetical protein
MTTNAFTIPTSYIHYADIVSQFNEQETIYNTGFVIYGSNGKLNPVLKINSEVSAQQNVILYFDFRGVTNLSLNFEQRPIPASIVGPSLPNPKYYRNEPPTEEQIQTNINNVVKQLRTTDPMNLLVIFCSDDLSDQLTDSRLIIDKSTNTIGLNPNLSSNFVPLALNGPQLLLIFKKSNLTHINKVNLEKILQGTAVINTTNESSLSAGAIIGIVIAIIVILSLSTSLGMYIKSHLQPNTQT